MLFVHDVHSIIGEHEFDFEDAVRDEYLPAVAEDGARLLWYLHSTHGAGEAYKVVTLTALEDGAALDRLVERLRHGDLAGWRERVDAMRYGSVSTLLVETEWSPAGALTLETIPIQADHDTVTYREDLLRGKGLDSLRPPQQTEGDAVLTCVAAFQPALTTDESLFILYRLAPEDRWAAAFDEDSGWRDWSGSLTPSLPGDVQRSSRMLRSTGWSPYEMTRTEGTRALDAGR